MAEVNLKAAQPVEKPVLRHWTETATESDLAVLRAARLANPDMRAALSRAQHSADAGKSDGGGPTAPQQEASEQ